MGRLVVIEGLDGAGKRTLADKLAGALGGGVARFAFPRYTEDVHAELVRDALYGRMGDLAGSVHGMAVLFALDRRAAAPALRAALASHDVVLVDRYVASNAAYGAARLHEGAAGEFVGWVRALEVERFGIPVPDHQLHLAVPRRGRRGQGGRPGADRRPRPRRLRGRRRPAEAHRRGVRRARRGGVAEPLEHGRRHDRPRGPGRPNTPLMPGLRLALTSG